MAKLLKLRRGTTTQHSSFTGAEGEVTVDTDKETLVVHDGSTAGGHPVAAEDLANVSSSTIAGRLSNDSIAVSKIAAGTLPSDVKIQDANVSGNLTIATADINADAVNGSKIADDSIDSEHYVDGSIDRTHLSADVVDGSKLADDSINSEHYVDGSIDTAHIANDQVTFAKVQNISTARILGNVSGSTGDVQQLSAANVRSMINVEDGATADQSNAEIRSAVEAASDSNVFTDADHSKLNGIEAGATADQTAEEIQDIVGAMVSGNTESGITVTYQDSDGTLDFSVASQTDQNFTNADHSKLDGIEAGATADQTGAEIASALNGQNIYTTGVIGRDSTDNISFANNSYMNIHINGNNEFRFESDGDFHADGDVIAFSTTISSDAKLKEDITLLPNALDKVEKLNGVTFKWKRDGAPSAGVIAQDVQKVLPEAVKEVTSLSNGEKHLSVNYHALTSILIESIKELKAEIEQLKGGQ